MVPFFSFLYHFRLKIWWCICRLTSEICEAYEKSNRQPKWILMGLEMQTQPTKQAHFSVWSIEICFSWPLEKPLLAIRYYLYDQIRDVFALLSWNDLTHLIPRVNLFIFKNPFVISAVLKGYCSQLQCLKYFLIVSLCSCKS